MATQRTLFELTTSLPEGFRYSTDVVTPEEEAELLEHLRSLPFESFRFHGFTGNRRVVSYGWRYDYDAEGVEEAADIPPFIEPLRKAAARFGGVPPAELVHVLVTEYQSGAGIGWHRDKAVFGDVIGISLLSPCRFRLRRRGEKDWERATITAAPRSAYLLSGPARTVWEHSIPPVDELRYSVTFRTLRSETQPSISTPRRRSDRSADK